jgi:hypothetical protein
MARGWESKDVETQQSLQNSGPGRRLSRGLSSTDRERINRRELLLLDRARLVNELDGARNERFRLQISAELNFIDRQLAQLTAEA